MFQSHIKTKSFFQSAGIGESPVYIFIFAVILMQIVNISFSIYGLFLTVITCSNSCPVFALSSPSCCIANCLFSSVSCQTVASRTTTVWMGIAPPRPRLPSRSLKFPRSPQNPRLHAGPVPPAASQVLLTEHFIQRFSFVHKNEMNLTEYILHVDKRFVTKKINQFLTL